MASAKIKGDVSYPEVGTRWVDNEDDGRTLDVQEVKPGNRLGREIRGTLHGGQHDGRPYATDIRTFNAVWIPLGVPVARS